MRLDSQLNFVPAPLSCVGATGASFPSPNVIDLLGQGVGTAPQNIIGNAATFGEDIGVGGGSVEPELMCTVGTAFVTGGSATLNVQLQASADSGVGGGYQPASWVTLEETGAISAANLTANQVIARFDWPPNFPANLGARYLRLNFVTPSGQQFSAGTIAFAGFTLVRDDQSQKYATKNYTVQ